MDINFKCEKCGKSQKKDDKKSNKNLKVFKANEKCECGGKFKINFK